VTGYFNARSKAGRNQLDLPQKFKRIKTSLRSALSTRLSTWNCSRLLLSAVLQPRVSAPVAAVYMGEQYFLPARRSAANRHTPLLRAR